MIVQMSHIESTLGSWGGFLWAVARIRLTEKQGQNQPHSESQVSVGFWGTVCSEHRASGEGTLDLGQSVVLVPDRPLNLSVKTK